MKSASNQNVKKNRKTAKKMTKHANRRKIGGKTLKRKHLRKQKGGRCPCELGLGGHKQQMPTMTGGGYGSSLQPIPLRNFYEANSYNNDPSVATISARNLPDMKGGKRKQKGGTTNVIEYTGTTNGAFFGRDLINGVPNVDPAPYVQPTLNINAHPMV